jgi:hypothetical protein
MAPGPSKPPKVRWRTRFLKALPFTDNLVSVVAGLLAITTFAAGAFGYVARNEREQRNELEGTVASLERERDDLQETNDTLGGEVSSLRDENANLQAQLADQPENPTTTPDGPEPPAEGQAQSTTYHQLYAVQELVITESCSGHENAADLDVPQVGAGIYKWDVDYYHCNGQPGRLAFAPYTRHAPGPAGATVEQCADALRRSGIGNDQNEAPEPGAVWCVETTSDSNESDGWEPKVVSMDIKAVDEGQTVTVNVQAWEPD